MRNNLWLVIFTPLFFIQVQAKEYQIIWNPYCPYTCDAISENGRHGVAIDIINEVFKDTPHTVTFKRIDSWLRAKHLISAGISDGMAFTFYSVGKTEPGFITPQIPMLHVEGSAFLSLAKNKISPFQIVDLARFNMIGSYRGSVNTNKRLERFLIENPHKVAYFTGSDILERVQYMLNIGRLDIWLDSPDLLRYFVKTKADDRFTVSHNIVGNKEYGGMLFNQTKAASTELAKMMDEGVKKLRENGKLKELLASYGMIDKF